MKYRVEQYGTMFRTFIVDVPPEFDGSEKLTRDYIYNNLGESIDKWDDCVEDEIYEVE